MLSLGILVLAAAQCSDHQVLSHDRTPQHSWDDTRWDGVGCGDVCSVAVAATVSAMPERSAGAVTSERYPVSTITSDVAVAPRDDGMATAQPQDDGDDANRTKKSVDPRRSDSFVVAYCGMLSWMQACVSTIVIPILNGMAIGEDDRNDTTSPNTMNPVVHIPNSSNDVITMRAGTTTVSDPHRVSPSATLIALNAAQVQTQSTKRTSVV